MIRIQRGAEPPGLKVARSNRLKKLAAGPTNAERSKILGGGYNTKATKQSLFSNQHKKCAWCERRADFSSSPVEHYRPRNGAWRDRGRSKQPTKDPDHYWWLAWTWTNLLFSCDRCNDGGHKSNYFPLADANVARVPTLPPTGVPPANFYDVSVETPLLLDPSLTDPLDHIRWVPLNTHLNRRQWLWSPDGLTEIGTATIWILKLEELTDDVGDHLKIAILPSVEEIEQHLDNRRLGEARARWNQLTNDVLRPEAELSAASWCALGYWVPPSTRAEHGFAAVSKP